MNSDARGRNNASCASCGIAEEREILPQEQPYILDGLLFKQPESRNLGDCPICCLPLPVDEKKSILQSCCSKMICDGCVHANIMRQREANLQRKCPFCRHPTPKSTKEIELNHMRRVKANDPVAICQMGAKFYSEGDYDTAFEYLTKAAGMGSVEAHNNLSLMYRFGKGVEMDEKKWYYHCAEAAIGGMLHTRYQLGYYEMKNGKFERGMRHFIIAANLGDDESLKRLNVGYREGLISKEDFAAALRAHQAAVDATKSPQREVAEKEGTGSIYLGAS